MTETNEEVIEETNTAEEAVAVTAEKVEVDASESDESTETEGVKLEEPAVEEEAEQKQRGLWYIIQCYSGQEHKVQFRIEELIEKMKLSDKIFRVLVPEEETVELKNNKRIEKVVKIYPGYVFIEMNYDDQVYFQVRNLAGVAKFITAKNKPVPVKEDEVLRVLRKIGDKTKTIDVDFEIDEVIKVISGPFRGYTGPISEIHAEKGTLKTLISIFGRETPVKLSFDQVEKTINS